MSDYEIAMLLEREERERFQKRKSESLQCENFFVSDLKILNIVW